MIKRWLDNEPKETLLCVVISAVALVLSISGLLKNVYPFDIAWIAIVLCGIPILVGAFTGVVFEHDIKADLLVSLALIASVATKEYFAAGEVALIMQIGSLLEDYTSGKAKKGIEQLIKMTPQTARVTRDGKEVMIPAEDVKIGDIVTVIAGETVPVDGIILSGETSIDQSVMTGESIPVDKKPGDSVFSGTTNQFGTFTMRTTAGSEDSSLQRMIHLTQEAEENKAPIVTAADRWATWLVVIALSCAIITWVVTGEFMRAVTVLVVFCPCAFILATPTAILAGIGNAAKYGIIVRSGDALERLAKIRRVAFDKTGTLTYGKPEVSDVISLASEYTPDDILRTAASAETRSEHPLGKAIVKAYRGKGNEPEEPSDFKMTAGQGIRAMIGSHTVLAGKADFLTRQKIQISDDSSQARSLEQKGATVIYVAIDNIPAGLIALSDTLRNDAKATVVRLKNAGITPVLLTGDNRAAAQAIAESAGISDVHDNLLPEEKMKIIQEYAGGENPVCMVGDGVNDALALTAADAGIAMGGIGSDIAIQSADAVLVNDDIKRLPYLFVLMQKVMKKIRVNIIASLIINITAVILSAAGILTPITGALWHNCGSIFVVVNAALLLRVKDDE